MYSMLREILESPDAAERTIERNREVVDRIAGEYKARNLTGISTVARGSSESAAIYFRYASALTAGLSASKFEPSIATAYGAKPDFKGKLVVAISQSGRSTDSSIALNAAKECGALTVSVTNDESSPLAKAADYHIFLASGEEKSVAATKSFVSELVAVAMLTDALAFGKTKSAIDAVPSLLKDFFHDYGAGKGTAVILLAPSGVFEAEFTKLAVRLRGLGACLIALTDIEAIQRCASDCAEMPKAEVFAQPFLYAGAGLLFAEKLAETKGLNPDLPRNLKKVTITE